MTQNLNRRFILAGLAASPLAACETVDANVLGDILNGAGGAGFGLSQADAARGIRAALDKGVGTAVSTVGVLGGYLNDGTIRIPLPSDLQRVQNLLNQVGAGAILNDLETALNRGAEKAAPYAKDLFLDVISNLSITDALNIVRGPSNAATQYLSDRTLPRLVSLFSPVMTDALQNTGALQLLDQLSGNLQNIPFAPQLGADAKAGLIEHGVTKGLSGLFHYIGEQEAAIRANPAERTSEILRQVFGGGF